jgi:hypothetical protein
MVYSAPVYWQRGYGWPEQLVFGERLGQILLDPTNRRGRGRKGHPCRNMMTGSLEYTVVLDQ